MAEILEKKILDLLDNREELVGRLSNLENMKSDTSDRVYQKIRDDYSAKLQSILEKISNERGSLEGKSKELTSEISVNETDFTKQSDHVDELQIRAKLGEFSQDNDSFKDELNQAESERDKTAGVLNKLRKDLNDINGVLSDVDQATATGVPGAGKFVKSKPAAVEDEEVLEIEDDELLEEIGEDESVDVDVDELMAEGSDTLKCPSCGHVNPPHLVVCEKCNAELEDLSQDLDDEFDFDDMDVDI